MTIAFPREETRTTTAPNPQNTACTCGAFRNTAPQSTACTCGHASRHDLRPPQRTTDNGQLTTPHPSTGPRSAAGKSKSSENARKHNLSASTPPPSLRENPTYQLSQQEFIEEFNPITPAQRVLVLQLTFVSWKLDQIPELERQLLATPLNAPEPATLETPTQTIDPQQFVIDALNTPGPFTPPPKDPTNDLTALHLQQNHPTPVTRLWDYHRRLLSRFQSLVRQIRTLQKQEAEIERQRSKDEADLERSRRRAKEDFRSPLDEELERMHQNNKQKDEQERQERLAPMTTPRPVSDAIASQVAPLAQPAPNSLAVSRINDAPLTSASPTAKQSQSAPKIAPAQNELPPSATSDSEIHQHPLHSQGTIPRQE
jgi:hypothetical protein